MNIGPTRVTKLVTRWHRWHDAYHAILAASWPRFFAAAVLVYMIANLAFATAYYYGGGVANASSFTDYFFFSVQTLATVGYGNMSPESLYAHWVATTEIITGVLTLAVLTSLVFARFSKPTARLLFSRVAVVAPYDGVPTLMLRVANQRQSYILEAHASLVLIRSETSAEGLHLRRFFELKLERTRSPLFALSWLLMHQIDETSPLHGLTAGEIEAGDMRLAVTLSGMDETFAANVSARHHYTHEDILFGYRFVDIFNEGENGRELFEHMELFHEVEPSGARGVV
ncbi:MAG: ion channel [Rhodanobacteraceae bacterium]